MTPGRDVKVLPGKETILQAFSRALAREAHVLTHHPDLLWQQHYNRLQWEGEELSHELTTELTARSRSSAKPWLHLKNPYRESETLVRTLTGHTDGVTDCAFSPNGQLIASASWDGTLRVWDAATGSLLLTLVLEDDPNWVTKFSFTLDGHILASTILGDTLKMWNASTGQELDFPEGFHNRVNTFTFQPDLSFTVSLSSDDRDHSLQVWEAASQRSQVLKGHRAQVNACSFSPDGRLLATASNDKTVRIWDIASGRALRTLKGHSDWVTTCSFSPDGSLVASAGHDKTIRIWDVVSGQVKHLLKGHTGWIHDCSFSPDGNSIASASVDKTVRIWESATGKTLSILEGHSSDVMACKFSPDGRFLVSASRDSTLRIWNANIMEANCSQEGHSDVVFACPYSPDGKLIASASRDETVRLWDSDTGLPLRTLVGHHDYVHDCAFSPDGHFIASESHERIRVWYIASGRTSYILKGLSLYGFSPGGRLVTSGRRAYTLDVWDTETGRSSQTIKCPTERPSACAFSPDGLMVATAAFEGNLSLWELHGGETIRTSVGHNGWVWACAFSPDGRLIASAGRDRTLRLWDTETGEAIFCLDQHSNEVTACCFSPDGRFIASASYDKTVRLWDSCSGEMLACLPVPGSIYALTMHPWTTQMACGDSRGALYRVEIVGFDYGPLIVTPSDQLGAMTVLCPACQQQFQIERDSLGSEITCPKATCSSRLKVNPFVRQTPAWI